MWWRKCLSFLWNSGIYTYINFNVTKERNLTLWKRKNSNWNYKKNLWRNMVALSSILNLTNVFFHEIRNGYTASKHVPSHVQIILVSSYHLSSIVKDCVLQCVVVDCCLISIVFWSTILCKVYMSPERYRLCYMKRENVLTGKRTCELEKVILYKAD